MRGVAVHEALIKLKFQADAAVLTPLFIENRKWQLNELSFPIIDVTFLGQSPLRIRMTCDDWDELPPSCEILNADGTPWIGPSKNGIFNTGRHDKTGRCFICMRGSREYHTHSSHLSDLWDNHRGQDGNNLPGILDQLSRAWRKAEGY
jgi:hypothetical protein